MMSKICITLPTRIPSEKLAYIAGRALGAFTRMYEKQSHQIPLVSCGGDSSVVGVLLLCYHSDPDRYMEMIAKVVDKSFVFSHEFVQTLSHQQKHDLVNRLCLGISVLHSNLRVDHTIHRYITGDDELIRLIQLSSGSRIHLSLLECGIECNGRFSQHHFLVENTIPIRISVPSFPCSPASHIASFISSFHKGQQDDQSQDHVIEEPHEPESLVSQLWVYANPLYWLRS